MKTKLLLATVLIGAAVFSARAGVDFGIQIGVPVPSIRVVPQYSVWDGYEHVGYYSGQYYYLGPRSVWTPLPPDRYERFRAWEGHHPNWRTHHQGYQHRHPEPTRYYRDRDHHRDGDRNRDNRRDMRTDLSSINSDFVPDYSGWENDFDELCRRRSHLTVKLQSPDLPAGVEKDIQERAVKNGFQPAPNQAGQPSDILIFTKSSPSPSQ